MNNTLNFVKAKSDAAPEAEEDDLGKSRNSVNAEAQSCISALSLESGH